MKRIFLFLLLFVLTGNALTAIAQPTVKARYSGGHAEFNIYLTLYSDSTYIFGRHSGLVIPTKSKITGTYSITDTSITLSRRKRQYFLLFFSWKTKKYIHSTYRIQGDKILMYTPEQEARDGQMARDYNTLTLVTW
jgi:hypothetical protein